MKPRSFYYSFVARGTTILAEYCASSVDFRKAALACLAEVPPDQSVYSVTRGPHTFNCITGGGYNYLVVADEDIGSQIPLVYLERVKGEFQRSYGGSRASKLAAHSLDDQFGVVLKMQMDFCMENPQEMDTNIQSKLRSHVLEVKSILMDNIDQILPLARTNTDADAIAVRAKEFYENQKRRRRKNRCKIGMIVLFISLLLGIRLIHYLGE
ncbi:hypothetical protein MPTK1_4g07690 [Marchantia polymorpha subsp. ruderalis]|uniref:Longin domain-containing protein n=2 Tax=Marchantia polymorpha TaxID=3197 RepID=A0AAF6B7I5_MARPO|nr:hypothetical protein MARPO_0115s0011 [Marchantia polymorpha]BBN07969.1 hypothetical protein Mp_4g07690 [Marchantia polymorpha subsp. ruderalis]|eukprot:PTQ31084.1 hypothetical protein MARPO_0115s0011 [Marchantia polymorpha]